MSFTRSETKNFARRKLGVSLYHWSPEEIAGTLKLEHPQQAHMHTSHESIYRYVYVVARGELQRELAKCLRRSHRTRKPHRRGGAATRARSPTWCSSMNVRPTSRTA